MPYGKKNRIFVKIKCNCIIINNRQVTQRAAILEEANDSRCEAEISIILMLYLNLQTKLILVFYRNWAIFKRRIIAIPKHTFAKTFGSRGTDSDA